jgi:hypothetical protein
VGGGGHRNGKGKREKDFIQMKKSSASKLLSRDIKVFTTIRATVDFEKILPRSY